MEDWQREHICLNRLRLIKNTDVNIQFLTILHSHRVISEEDISNLEIATKNRQKKASEFYDIIQTKLDGYEMVKKALHATKQTGAFDILSVGNVNHDSTQSENARRTSGMEKHEQELIRSRLSDLIIATKCNFELLGYCEEKEIFGFSDVETIAIYKDNSTKASMFYRLIQTRTGAFPVLIEGLKKTNQDVAVRMLTAGEALTDEERKAFTKRALEDAGEEGRSNKRSRLEEPKAPVKFDVVPPVNLFTGRKVELERLHRIVMRSQGVGGGFTVISQMASVSGLGGIGKTQLARQYVYLFGDEFDGNVIWLNAETEATLGESFRRLATDKLNVSTTNANGAEKGIKHVVEEVYNKFIGRKALFVFDNAEKGAWLKELLPLSAQHNKNLHILMTSRDREWERGMAVLDLREFSNADAVAFVVKGLEFTEVDSKKQIEDISNLVNRLQCFPLALQQAISFIHHQQQMKDYSISDYLVEFERMQFKMLSIPLDSLLDDYLKTTATTWNITVEKIGEDPICGNQAVGILHAIAYLYPIKIKRALFYKPMSTTSNQVSEAEQSSVNEAVRLLIKYSMINGENQQSILSIHRMVQEVTRIYLNRDEKEEKVLEGVIELLWGHKDTLPTEFVEHSVVAWRHAWEYSSLIKSYSNQIDWILWRMNDMGRHDEGIRFGKESLEKVKPCIGDDSAKYLWIEIRIASILRSQRKFSEALSSFQTIVSKSDLLFGKDDYLTLVAQEEIANVLLMKGELKKAFSRLHGIYEKKAKLNGSSHEYTLNAQHNYARSLGASGQLEEALRTYRSIIKKYIDMYGEDAVNVLHVRVDVANLFYKKGSHEDGIKIYENVLQTLDSRWKENVNLFASVSSNLAIHLIQAQRYDDALSVLKGSFEKIKSVLGEQHYTTLHLHKLIEEAVQGCRQLNNGDVTTKRIEKQELSLVRVGENTNSTMNMSSLIHSEAQHGDIGDLEFAISLGLDVNSTDNEGLTPLWYAFKDQNKTRRLEKIKLLLQKDANPRLFRDNRCSFLHALLHNDIDRIGRNPFVDLGITKIIIIRERGNAFSLTSENVDPSLSNNNNNLS